MPYDNFNLADSVAAGRGLVAPIGDAINTWRARETSNATSDAILQHELLAHRITPAEYETYRQTPDFLKSGIAAGLIQNIADDWKRAVGQSEIDYRKAHEQFMLGRDKISDWAHQKIWVTDANGNTYEAGEYDEQGNPHYLPYGGPQTNRNRAAGPPPSNLLQPPGMVWDGFKFVPDPNLRKRTNVADDLTQLQALSREAELRKLDEQIASIQGEIAGGNQRPGPDWLPWVTTPYADQLKQLRAKRDALAGSAPPATSTGTGTMPNSVLSGVFPGVPNSVLSGGLLSGGRPIQTDRGTGLKYYLDDNGEPQLLPGQQAPQGPSPLPPTTGQPPLPLGPTTGQMPTPLPTAPTASSDGSDFATITQARDAIRRGAPRAAVEERLRQMGVDPSGL